MTELSPVRVETRWEARAAKAALVLFLLFVGTWLAMRNIAPSLTDRDWVAFDNAATRAWSGQFSEVYRASAREKFGFLYPPYAIWFTLPLGLVGATASYVAILAASILMLVAAGALLARLPGVERPAVGTVVLVALASGTWMQVAITGQNSAAYVLALVAALVLRQEARPRWAGVCLAFLAVKPNLLVAPVVYLLCRRERRVLEGVVTACATLLGSTLVMGTDVWGRFRDALHYVDGLERVPQSAHGQVTLLAAVRVVLTPLGQFAASKLVWAVLAAVLATGVVAVWARGRWSSGPFVLRAGGTAVLASVALNVRLYFYDALILVVPAALWYLLRASYVSARRRAVIGACAGVCFVAGFSEFGALPTSPLIGVAATVWLVAELTDLNAASTTERAAGSGASVADASVADAPVADPSADVPAHTTG